MHYKLDSVLVLLWPGVGDVDQSLEQHHTVSYHVEIEFPPEENIFNLISSRQSYEWCTKEEPPLFTAPLWHKGAFDRFFLYLLP